MALVGLALALLPGCERPPAGSLPPTSPSATAAAPTKEWFEDVTVPAGIDFVHQVAVSGNYLYSETMGSGAAAFDFDQDGLLDFYFIHNAAAGSGAANKLFRQESPGHFRDVSAGSGLDTPGLGNGLAVGDVNNDGLPDLVITEYDRVRLLVNQGGGKFRDMTLEAGITNRQWSVAAAFFDYDRDGWLDLVIGNYLDFDPQQRCPDAKGRPEFCGPAGFRPTLTRLWHNLTGRSSVQPATIRFEDVTVASGLGRAPGKAMGILCADFDGDRWPDVFVTDDDLPNRLFMNQRDGTFRNEAVERGVAYTGTGAVAANMGIAVGDVDGDGLFDLFVPHLADENPTLWRQRKRGLFQDETAPAGLLAMHSHATGFGAVLADFDADGALDLAVVNGLVRRRPGPSPVPIEPGLAPFWHPYAQPNQLLANAGTGSYREVSRDNPSFCAVARVGRGLVCADFDNDGRPDLVSTSIGARARLYRNTTGQALSGRHWLGVRAIEPGLGGRDAYGAEVEVFAGARRWWRLIQPAYSYASSNDPRAQFGLGEAAAVDRVVVRWPDGRAEAFVGGPADRYLTLRKGEGRPDE